MNKTRKTPESILPEGLMAEMLATLPAKTNAPSAKRRAAIKQSLLSRVQAESREDAAIKAAEMRIVRADEGKWFSFAPSVQMKVLHDDGDTRTWLARFQAGGCIPAHMQTGDEEAIVLEGWCYVGEHIMRKGDYQLIPKGARHGEIVSPEGCLVFVRSHSAKRSAAELAITL
jgi:quercetin dioxygenase-like cupin family protein